MNQELTYLMAMVQIAAIARLTIITIAITADLSAPFMSIHRCLAGLFRKVNVPSCDSSTSTAALVGICNESPYCNKLASALVYLYLDCE